jgi:hypothetical protein
MSRYGATLMKNSVSFGFDFPTPENEAVNCFLFIWMQQRVDALVRTLVGSAGVRRDGKIGEGVEKGLDHLMCADGFDVETGIHKV